MLGRLFGRTKDEHDDTVCSNCGRTLLAGEWTQRIVDNDGTERYICSLCARPESAANEPAEPAETPAAVGGGRVKPARSDTDAFWRALKDKDAEIERLESLLARSEAEKQELAAQLALMRGESTAERRPDVGADTAEMTAADFDDAGETASAGAPETDIGDHAEAFGASSPAPAAAAPLTPALERTDPRLGEAMRRASAPPDAQEPAGGPSAAPGFQPDDTVGAPPVPSVSPFDDTVGAPPVPSVSPFDDGVQAEASAEPFNPGAAAFGDEAVDAQAPSPPAMVGSEPDAQPDAEEFMPLTILQRGVDLLNVSAVPKRVVETNDNLGMPQVHVGSQDESTLLVTFMWTMGWYQFRVELADAGRITLADRGYEERVDLRPNASARPDGTVQLAASQIKPPTPKDTSDAKPAGVTSGVIISKSMKGQRTDDENVPADWKSTRAPDFDWGR